MTKAEYIDFIRNSLPMVDKTSRFHREQVGAAINVAVNTVFYEIYRANPKVFMKSMERYTTRATIIPVNITLRGRYTAPITVDIVDLPKKAGGVLEIMQWDAQGIQEIGTTTTDYIPVTTMEGEQFYGSEASLPGNVVGYSWSGAREIEFWGISAAEASQGVSVRFIQQFKSYSNTDNVVLPYGQDQRIMQLVREFLGVTPPKDTINDNADG